MSFWVYLPLLLSGVFGAVAPRIVRFLPPPVATWLLSAGGIISAAASSASLALLVFVLAAQNSVLSHRGQWSDQVLRAHDPLVIPVGILALGAVVVLSVRFVRVLARRALALRDAYRLSASFAHGPTELTVLDSGANEAFAVPGRPGRIVVSAGLLRRLDGAQRRALLAHERAHLDHHHHIHQTVAHLVAAVNPMLGPLALAVKLSCERWADEDAARACHRSTVAEALTRAATGARGWAPEVALAAAVTEVGLRVGALRVPARPMRVWPVTMLSLLMAMTAMTVVLAMHDTEQLFELAQHVYRTGRR